MPLTTPLPPPSASLIKSRIHYAPDISVAYLKNPKVACSTVTGSLWLRIDEGAFHKTWRFRGNAHIRGEAPFCRDLTEIASSGIDRFLAAEFFSVVRNPYSRMLSCYLDKFADPRSNPDIRLQFADQFGLLHDAVPSFRTFLDLISTATRKPLTNTTVRNGSTCFTRSFSGSTSSGILSGSRRLWRFCADTA